MYSDSHQFRIPTEIPKIRIDKWLCVTLGDTSRTEIQQWIRSGNVTVNGKTTTPGTLLSPGMEIVVTPPHREEGKAPQPEDRPLDILFEDEHLVAINKPSGQVVHPAPGHPGNTLVNALLHRYPELSGVGPPERPGVVHRLDADTSGVILFARSSISLGQLQEQFRNRTTQKTYLCVCRGIPNPISQTVRTPIGRHPVHRQKRHVNGIGAREALTTFSMRRGYAHGEASELEVQIETGRTHQIRVHLSSLDHPILGDPVYGGRRTTLPTPWPAPPRLMLHAAAIRFTHPDTGTEIQVTAPPPPAYITYLELLSH